MGYGAFRTLRNGLVGLLFLSTPIIAEPVVIAAMGDSLTQGYGLDADDGFVPQMQNWLDANGADVRLINAGVSGDTTSGGLARAAWTLTPDVDAMIVALGANDYLRGIPPDLVRENLQGILEVATAQEVSVLIVGLEVGSNYGPGYKQTFDAIYRDLAEEFGVSYFRSWFVGLEDEGGSVQTLSQFFQDDGIHPNADGVARIVAAMGPAVADLAAGVE